MNKQKILGLVCVHEFELQCIDVFKYTLTSTVSSYLMYQLCTEIRHPAIVDLNLICMLTGPQPKDPLVAA